MLGRALLTTAVACCALAAGGAQAATPPVVAGNGSFPRVAVDAAGNGYLAWIDSKAASSGVLHYCKLPAAGTACTAPFQYTDNNIDVDGGWPLVTPDGRVMIVETRGVSPTIAKLLWTSSDAGATFAGPTQIGVLAHNGGNISGRALFAPAGALGLGAEALMTIGAGAATTAPFQATGTGASSDDSSAELAPNIGADIALQGDTLVALLGDFPSFSWSQYTGPRPATLATLNTAANWSAPQQVGPRSAANTETLLAGGPGGIYAATESESDAGNADLVLRKFNGSGWDAPVTIARHVFHPDVMEDPAGRLHALWTDTEGIHYSYTADATNSVWSAPQSVVTGESTAFPRLAVNSAGNGWAVWSAGDGTIHATPLRPVAGTYAGATTPVKTTSNGGEITLAVPKDCVAVGQQFRVTLSWKRQRRKGNLFVKVKRTDFYLSSKVLKVDRRAPFVYTYRVAVTQAPGSTITVRARAFIKVRHGKTPKKSIRAKVKVCS
jgi:hypothetical protein